MSNDPLKQHRDAIDQLDKTILDMLNQRAQHARRIGEIKGSTAVYRPEREAQVLHRIQKINHGPLSDESVARLFREIMSECLAIERPLSIAYLGPEGTFSQQAAVKHFGHAAHNVSCATIADAFRQVEARTLDYVVAPVENSTEGAVGTTLDLMITTPLKICGEVSLRIHDHLMSLHGDATQIQRVYSHAQSLAQCHEWLNKNLPDVERIAVASNAEAARLASIHANCAAIAGQSAAEHFSLVCIHKNIEDEPNNTTRFLVLGHQQTGPSKQDKTSIIVSVPHQSGAVYQLLEPFAAHKLSMTKFESRPSRTGLWEYVFFIDFMGHESDQNVTKALQDLKAHSSFIKILGSYPCAVL